MTSPSRYTSTVRVDVGNAGKHLSEGDNDVTGKSVTSSRNSLSVLSPAVSRGQSEVVAYVRLNTPEQRDGASPGLINGLETVTPPGESDRNHHQQQQRRPKGIPKTFRAVSVPAKLHRDLDFESLRSLCEDEGHQKRFSSDVKVTLLQPSRE